MMRARKLKGFPVIDLESGVMIGRVQELLVDPARKKAVALVVGEKGLLKGKGKTIPFNSIHSIGNDAVTVSGETSKEEKNAETASLKGFSFLGNSVISSAGDYLAKVHDYIFSKETGELNSLLLHDLKERDQKDWEACLLIEGVQSLGRDYVIAATGYENYLQKAPDGEPVKAAADNGPETWEAGGTASEIRGRVNELWDKVEQEVSREGKELAHGTKKQVKTYVLGKKAGYTVKDMHGNFLVRGGEEITEEILRTAEAQERLAPLFFAVISGEVEDSLNIIGDRINRIFRG